jgi:hypothetical protein
MLISTFSLAVYLLMARPSAIALCAMLSVGMRLVMRRLEMPYWPNGDWKKGEAVVDRCVVPIPALLSRASRWGRCEKK